MAHINYSVSADNIKTFVAVSVTAQSKKATTMVCCVVPSSGSVIYRDGNTLAVFNPLARSDAYLCLDITLSGSDKSTNLSAIHKQYLPTEIYLVPTGSLGSGMPVGG